MGVGSSKTSLVQGSEDPTIRALGAYPPLASAPLGAFSTLKAVSTLKYAVGIARRRIYAAGI